MEYEEVEKQVITSQPCVECGSSDAMAIYIPEGGDVNAYCFSCETGFDKEDLSDLEIDTEAGLESYLKRTRSVKKSTGNPLTQDQLDFIKARSTFKGKMFRGISDATLAFYRIRTEFDGEGNVYKRYYPNTIDYEASSYQVRVVPDKMFFFMGKAGNDTQFFGQRMFKDGGKRVLIVGGQEDCAASQEMMWDYQCRSGKSEYGRMAIVSTPSGEGCSAIVKKQFNWLDSFEEIYFGLDNDAKGIAAMMDAVQYMPKGKVKIVKWSEKDPNAMLEAGKEVRFISDFFDAKQHVPIGISDSTQLSEGLREVLLLPKVTLPPFMSKVQELMGGGFPRKKIINIAAETSIGKCHGKGTKILMSDASLKNVEDVVEGEYLMGEDGNPKEVFSTTSGVDKLYKISQQNGDDYVVNSAHILSLVVSCKSLKGFGEKGDIVNINVEDYLDLSHTQRRLLKGYKGKLDCLSTGGLTIDPYALGLWLADGTSGKAQYTVADSEKEIQDYLQGFCKVSGYSLAIADQKGACKSYNISGGLFKALRELNLLNNKHVPQPYKTSSRQERMQLLAGILDGDGYVSSKCYDLVLKDTPLVDGVVYLARSLGFKVSVTDKFAKCQGFAGDIYKRITISGNTYEVPVRLPKRVCSERLANRNPLYTSIKVEELDVGEYYGFTISGNSLYCLGDLTVTHNTTVVNEIIYHLIYEPNCLPCIVTLELDQDEYGLTLLSRHHGNKVINMSSGQEAVDWLDNPHRKEREHDLFYDENNDPRFYLVDDRSSTIKSIQDKVEELVVSFGCNMIVFDPLTDLIDGQPLDVQAAMMSWQKDMKKNHDVTFLNVLHVRDTPSNNEQTQTSMRFIKESDIHGSSSQVKSADCNILLSRNKYSDDPTVKNTTEVWMPKCRWSGQTGRAGKWYYENKTHKLYDRDYYDNVVLNNGVEEA